MIIGLVPGAMKPYHAGHHYLVEKALKECDKVFIITTTKSRGCIDGQKMQKAWRSLIQPCLGTQTSINFAISPIRFVYEMIEEEDKNPSGNIYRIYGGTEDLNRFEITKLKSKYPNASKVFINVAQNFTDQYSRGVGASPLAKGKWVRNSIQEGKFTTFKNYLPEILKKNAKAYWNILI